MTNISLWDRYQALKLEKPSIWQFDAAEELGVSEAELVSVLPNSKRLLVENKELVLRLEKLGNVKSIARNKTAVHEKEGVYNNVQLHGNMGLALNQISGLDLRFFLNQWGYIFATQTEGKNGLMRAIQIFDTHGAPVQKLFLLEDANVAEWQALIDDYAAPDAKLDHTPVAVPANDTDADLDLPQFHNDWLALTDIHEFHGLLKKHGVSRRNAFQNAPQGYAYQLKSEALEEMLNNSVSTEVPIMVFAGNRGLVQIHTSAIKNVKRMAGWLNIFDPDFTLHILESEISEIWLIRRPIAQGMLTAIEVLGRNHETVLTFFGQRQEDQDENQEWTKLAMQLPAKEGEVSHVA